jgi:prevent-host-death family protein
VLTNGWKGRVSRLKRVALHVVKDDLSRYLREAQGGEIIITRHGKPAGVLRGFASEDDWFDYRLENDPRFLERVRRARADVRQDRGTELADLQE